MKRTVHLMLRGLVCGLFIFGLAAGAQVPAASNDGAKVMAYIHGGWDTLSRSMAECKSVVDTKVTTVPVLYLPTGMATPAAVAAMQSQCQVEVARLPRKISQMGDMRVAEIPKEGLLYLPNRYVVPGGRFNEMYGWDSYFIILGLVADGRTALAKGMVENFFFEIENYGAVLNANRTYFFTRSQPPFLTSMMRAVWDEKSPSGNQDKAWLAKAYGYASRDYELWTSPVHMAGATGLARYEDIGVGPVPEMADDSGYYSDVIRWMEAHPEEGKGYLVDAPEEPTAAQVEELAKTSCDVRVSKVCARAHVEGHRLTAAFYRGDRAMRESGFDTTFRFGPFSGSTDQYAPVCLNSLLYKYEMDMAYFAGVLGKAGEKATWEKRAAKRKAAVDKYLWNAAKGMYEDYEFSAGKQSSYAYVTAFYPLWAGMASKGQAAAMRGKLGEFEHEGGLAMSATESGVQWDLPFGWAPTNWLAVKGLDQYGYKEDAARVSKRFMATVRENWLTDGTIREKYNVVSGSANVKVAAGYKSNVVGFGWTNGVYAMLKGLIAPVK